MFVISVALVSVSANGVPTPLYGLIVIYDTAFRIVLKPNRRRNVSEAGKLIFNIGFIESLVKSVFELIHKKGKARIVRLIPPIGAIQI